MTAFAQASDLQTLDPSLSDDMAELVLEMVSDGIRSGLHWQVDQFTSSVTVTPDPYEYVSTVVVPGRNLSSVTVTVDGNTLTAGTDYILDAPAGVVRLLSRWYAPVTVAFTAGWTAANRPSIFRTVALEWALQYAANPTNVRQYTMGKIQETFAGTASSALVIEDPRLDIYSLGPGF